MDALEALIDKQIRKAIEEGAFDNLPGSGKPIADLDQQLEPGWWAARTVRRERSRARADELRDQLAADVGALWMLTTEPEVRAELDRLNRHVRTANANLEADDRLSPLAVGEMISTWRRVTAQRRRNL